MRGIRWTLCSLYYYQEVLESIEIVALKIVKSNMLLALLVLFVLTAEVLLFSYNTVVSEKSF